MKPHPFNQFPKADPDEIDALEADMAKYGYDPDYPVLLYEGMILDGWHRYRAALKVGITPIYKQFKGTPEEARAKVRRANTRRNLTPEYKAAQRKERVLRVATARAAGLSTRAIAETECVSQRTVMADMDLATEWGYSVETENGEITGKDGKKRSATKPKPPPTIPVDAFGTELPKHCRVAYCDSWMQWAIDLLAQTEEKFRQARVIDGINKRKKLFPFVNVRDVVDGCGFVMNYLDQIIEHLKEKRPAGVCPACAGKGCSKCKMSGLVPRGLYKELSQ